MKNSLLFGTLVLDLVAIVTFGMLGFRTVYILTDNYLWSWAAAVSVSYLMAMIFFVVIPSLQKSAGAGALTAGALVRQLRGASEADDLESGQRHRRFRNSQIGFAPQGAPRPEVEGPLVPAPACSQCNGSGHQPGSLDDPCTLCKGSGRKQQVFR